MAILMASAAVPWIGMLMAMRSPDDLTRKLLDWISGMYLRRPSTVWTYPFIMTCSFVEWMYSWMPGYLPK